MLSHISTRSPAVAEGPRDAGVPVEMSMSIVDLYRFIGVAAQAADGSRKCWRRAMSEVWTQLLKDYATRLTRTDRVSA